MALYAGSHAEEIPSLKAPPRFRVGGLNNRWLNITYVDTVGGAEDPDSKIFICEVCEARATPSEQCSASNFTLKLVGAPPKFRKNLS
jgi:hypothetical protein